MPTGARNRRDAYMVFVGLLAALLGWTSLASAPTAAADTASYVQKLHDAGINTARGDVELKEWGWEVCALFDRGVPPDKVVQQAVYNSASKPPYGMSTDQANLVVDTAVSDLCAQSNHG
jgi:hypothetical protein